MTIKRRSRITVFVLTYLVWMALTGIGSLQELSAGLVIALIVSFIAGHFLITTDKNANFLKRAFFMVKYIFIFIWEMIKANLHVAYLVIHPMRPIKPGIVKVKTTLTKDSALTVLCNSITLTPGTLTVDLDADSRNIYIHWIDVKTESVEGATQEIVSRFEKVLKEVFE